MDNMKKMLESDLIEVLLDKTNTDPIVLCDERGRTLSFEQVAIIPRKRNGRWVLYAVLKPLDSIEGVADDEAIVFYVDESADTPVLKVELDEESAIEVFHEYYDLLEDNRDEKSKLDFLRGLNNKRKGGAE